MYTASMNWLMLASDTQGRPLGKFAATASCCEPAEMSVTVPVIVTGVEVVTPTLGRCNGCFAWSHAVSVYLVVICVEYCHDAICHNRVAVNVERVDAP